MPNDRPHHHLTMSYHRVTLRLCSVLLLLTIKDVINLEITSQRHSGLYMDNEVDPSTVDGLTADTKLALENELLKRLGLPGKPQRPTATGPLNKQSAQKFLLDVYKVKVDRESETTPNTAEPSEFDLTGSVLRTIDQSDAITTFAAQQADQKAVGAPDRVTGIWFDVEAAPADSRLISAQLRLYRNPSAKNRKNRGDFIVTAYRVLRPTDGAVQTAFVDSAGTTAGHGGWITLDVTESLTHWMAHPGDNKGLYLSARSVDPASEEIRPEDIGIVGLDGDARHQPFLAGFFSDNESNKAAVLPATLGGFQDYDKRNRKRDTTDKSGGLCDVQKRYVSFKDIHWDNWIIAPEGINVNFCSGGCNRVNDGNYHATIQQYMNEEHPGTMPDARCVPTKLSGIDALYYTSNNTVVMRKWDNVTVEACNCI